MKIALVIPARYGSTRFSGKPLATIAGKSLLARTWAIGTAAVGIDRVVIATDDDRVAEHARSFGAEVVLTDESCQTGSDRTAAALGLLGESWDAAINLQGDAVLTPPWVLEALAHALRAEPAPEMVTAAVRLDQPRYQEFLRFKREHPTSGTTVVLDARDNALYFSKAIIPALRNSTADPLPPVFRHIGVYGYTADTLRRFAELAPSPLEKAEGLEQLRALENGIPIRVVAVDYRGRTHWSVDGPSDIAQAEAIIGREGELVR